MKELLNLEQREEGSTSDRVIILKSVFANKGSRFTVQPAKDPVKNWFLGIPRLSEDQKKTLEYFATPESKLVLTDGYKFDLNDPIQKANWDWVKHCACVCDSFDAAQRTPNAQFYVHIPGREARQSNDEATLRYRAVKHVMEDSPSHYENRALLLDRDMSGESPDEVKQFLLETAERTPRKIIAAYEAKDLGIKLLVIRAEQKGILVKKDGVVTFGPHILGVSIDSAIAFLRSPEHKTILDLLSKDVENSLEIEAETTGKEKKSYNFNKKG